MPEVAHDINCAFYEGKHLLMLLLLAKTCAVVFFRDGFEKKPLGLVRELDNVLFDQIHYNVTSQGHDT